MIIASCYTLIEHTRSGFNARAKKLAYICWLSRIVNYFKNIFYVNVDEYVGNDAKTPSVLEMRSSNLN